MIVDTLKNIATNRLNMDFAYGDKPSLNLKDGTVNDKYCFWLLPVDNKPQLNEYNRVIANSWDIALFMFIQADMDGGMPSDNGEDYYSEKWTKSIKPLYDTQALNQLTMAFTCIESLTLTNLTSKEVINLFDANMDGLYITFTIKEDVI